MFPEPMFQSYFTVSLSKLAFKKANFSLIGFPGGSEGKVSAYNVGDLGSIPVSGRSPGEGNGNPSSILAWRIPWTEEPGRLHCIGSQKVKHDLATEHTHTHTHTHT